MNLIDLTIRRPVFTSVLMLMLVVFGGWAYNKVGVDLYPDVDVPVVTVTAVYPGADPTTIESRVVEPLEEAINGVSGLEELRSTSSENVAVVVAQFALEVNGDQAAQDVRDKVASILAQLPEGVESPVIQKLDLGAQPIISLVLSAPVEIRDLTSFAEDEVKARLQKIQGVGNIDIVGGRDREFHVDIDPIALESFGLSVTDVASTLQAQNVELPGGRIITSTTEFGLKTVGEVHSAEAIGQLIIASQGGRAVRIRDVAKVLDTSEEKRSHASLNGTSAVTITVTKQSGANTVEVARDARAELEDITKALPEGWALDMPVDNSVFIERTIGDVQFDLVFGAILAILIILFFLRDWRATLVSALALPTSVIATVFFIYAMGFTFNTLTMLALTLSIGILIDDAIVVIENIHRHMEMGKTAWQAAQEGTKEIALAVLAITLSIVAVFVPVAMMKGIIGRFFFQFGLTVAFAVAMSLFVALTLTPMLSARVLKQAHHKPGRVGAFLERLLGALDRGYEALARKSLSHPFVVMGLAIGAFVFSLGLFTKLPVEFTPAEDRGEFIVFAEYPPGTRLEDTIEVMEDVASTIRESPGVELTLATIGGGVQGQVNKGTIHVEILDAKSRDFSQEDAIRYLRERISEFPGTYAIEPIANVSSGSGRQATLQYVLQGNDMDSLDATADKVIERMMEAGVYVDVDKSSRPGKPELSVEIDRVRAADLGVPVADIALAIRMLYAGDKATEIATDGERFEVKVRIDEALRHDPGQILGLKVRSRKTGQLVPLSNIVEVKDTLGPAQIARMNRQRQVTIYANLDGIALGAAMQEVGAIVEEVSPDGVSSALSGTSKNLEETLGYMIEALILAIVLIYLILAAQFESWIHPLTIMVSLPLSLIGAFGALVIFGMPMSIFTMIGFIMLMGLVTKNAVLMVDYTNVLRAEGLNRFEALVKAGTVRLRPILMTTAAMIGGMMPVALAMSSGGEVRAPMAAAVIGGLITSTFLTLIVIPVVYTFLDRLSEVFQKRPTLT